MGGSVSRILSGLLWTKKEIRILILGLVYLPPHPRISTNIPTHIGDRTMPERQRSYIDSKYECTAD